MRFDPVVFVSEKQVKNHTMEQLTLALIQVEQLKSKAENSFSVSPSPLTRKHPTRIDSSYVLDLLCDRNEKISFATWEQQYFFFSLLP